MDLDTPGTADTPRRFRPGPVRRHRRLRRRSQAGHRLSRRSATGDASCELAQIVEGPIPFFALCEHHALPFYGEAYVGYVAHEQIIGISKLTRLVRVVTQRFGVQERMTHADRAKSLEELLGAHGVAVYMGRITCARRCAACARTAAMTRTTSYRGVYERDPNLRAEFFRHLRHRRGQPPMSIAAPPASRFGALIQADRPWARRAAD